ncbi:MAG: ABC transporter substrate-binding protein [Alphaproteobacteria bacterium]|nr:ABC transporter substrate-binding protein [Alphaproteobacteria bacterium]
MRIPTRLVLGAAALAVVGMSGAASAQDIRIGEINSYKRLPAFLDPYRNGWEMALDEINAEGGVSMDGKKRKLVVITRDDAGKPGNAVKIAEELVSRENVALLAGGFLSNIGLALADFAKQKKVLYLAGEPLSDALVWESGNRYTFRLRPSTYMQAAMLAEEAAKAGKTKWAAVAPNYAYGKDGVGAYKKAFAATGAKVEWIEEQWPPVFKIDAGPVVRALEQAKPEAIYNVLFGPDLLKFAREGKLRGLFEGRMVVGLLTGEPEYLDPLKDEAPEGWIVTGYPWYAIDTPAHNKFRAAYEKRFKTYPRTGSIVGYNLMLSLAAVLEKAGSTDTEKLVDAMKGLKIEDSPSGPFEYRAIDHQSTMGAWVGRTAVRDGKPVMVDWSYRDGAKYLPPDEEVRKMRPAD